MLKRFLIGLFNKLGYEVHRKESIVSQIGFNPAYLSQICQPKTVIDVGVGHGTFSLYKAFPNAHFVLIEPLKDYKRSIEKIAQKYDCEIHYKAVGDEECDLEINVDTNNLQRSSFMDRTTLTTTGNRIEKRTVEVTTLDTIYSQSASVEGPILLKIDTEGHEMSALKGARALLQVVDIAIVEVSIARRFKNSYKFEDVVVFMDEIGFSVFSFLTMVHPKGEIQPRFADVVFKRRSKEI
ncbi:MAG: FkbM family methyltransferase [Candidatus Cloacimonetes bacterium]|nr:FkbM family methyltransferase [Candidatus Cloacimonadota bacterium]